MTYPDTPYQCPYCQMRFAVVQSFPNYGEVTWCSERGCKVRFCHWSSEAAKHIRCEVLQADLESPTGRAALG